MTPVGVIGPGGQSARDPRSVGLSAMLARDHRRRRLSLSRADFTRDFHTLSSARRSRGHEECPWIMTKEPPETVSIVEKRRKGLLVAAIFRGVNADPKPGTQLPDRSQAIEGAVRVREGRALGDPLKL